MTKSKFKEAEALNGVSKFHHLFRLAVLDAPTVPDADRCRLRINLIQEELNELKVALEQKDIVEVADACADLQYVLSGAILEFGLGESFNKLFAEVQRSNMSKACTTQSEAEQTLQYYAERDGTIGVIEPVGDKFLVYRDHDRKVLKSINYSPADLQSILQQEDHLSDSCCAD